MKLETATRYSGEWFTAECTRRLEPCGNAYCADETMRAKDVQRSLGGNVAQEIRVTIAKRIKKCEGCGLVDRDEFLNSLFEKYGV